MSTVSSVTSGGSLPIASDSVSGSAKTLDQNAFLQLLVKQIQFQDPLNPKSDTDMAAQMAQFTSLQQASQTTSSLAMIQANSLIGNTVTIKVDSQTVDSGVVSGVSLMSGKPQILVNGTLYDVSQVMSVAPTPVTPAGSQTN